MRKENPGITPAPMSVSDATAMQAFAAGTANEGQQKHVLDWILRGACAIGDWPYRTEEKETYIQLGRQFAGQQIYRLMRVNVSELRKKQEKTSG